jgi:ABC-type multidrug transport system ATPase subunit
MDEADRCATVGLMVDGRLAVCAAPDEIRAGLGGDMVEVVATEGRSAHAVLADVPGVREIQTYGEALHVLVDSAAQRLPRLKEALEAHDVAYSTIRQATPRMEEAFISMIHHMDEEEE